MLAIEECEKDEVWLGDRACWAHRSEPSLARILGVDKADNVDLYLEVELGGYQSLKVEEASILEVGSP